MSTKTKAADTSRPDDGADAWMTPKGLVTVAAPVGASPYIEELDAAEAEFREIERLREIAIVRRRQAIAATSSPTPTPSAAGSPSPPTAP